MIDIGHSYPELDLYLWLFLFASGIWRIFSHAHSPAKFVSNFEFCSQEVFPFWRPWATLSHPDWAPCLDYYENSASPRLPPGLPTRANTGLTNNPDFSTFPCRADFGFFSLNIWESSILGCSRTFQIGSILKQLLSRNQLECQKFPYCLKMSRMLQMCQNSTTHKNMSHILNWKTPNYQNVQYVRSVL